MPPREDGSSPKSFTWITGNPRSKKNITQIRRHAGQNSGVKAETGARAHSSSSPKPGHKGSTRPFRAVYPSPRLDAADEQSSGLPTDHHINFQINHPSTPAEYSAFTPTRSREQSAPSQTGWPGTPSSEAPSSALEDVTQPRKLAIWDLVNHSPEEEEQHRQEVLASTPRQDNEDDRSDYFVGGGGFLDATQSPREPQRSLLPPPRKTPSPAASRVVVPAANIAKRRKATTAATPTSQLTWRLGMTAPSHSLALPEDSQIEQILLQTSAFYTGRFESSWSAQLRNHGPSYFDKTPDMENFAGSVTTAGGLMELGCVDAASAMLSRVLPMLPDLLTLQTPQVYFLLADISLSANPHNPLGRVRSQVRYTAASTASSVLGPAHPITKILQVRLPDGNDLQRQRLRELVQRKTHDLLNQFLEPNSYQASAQHYFLARVLGQLGKFDQERDLLSKLVADWESIYGRNSMMPITGLLELARAQLFLDNCSQDTESLLSDALHRTLTLEEQTPANPSPASVAKAKGLAMARIGCLRTMGRLHVMRDNLETALMQYTAAMSLGVEELGVDVPAVQLALADLDAVSKMIAARSAGDDSLRLAWLQQIPVEVGIRWVDKDAKTSNPATSSRGSSRKGSQ
jgi:hypothetical protein